MKRERKGMPTCTEALARRNVLCLKKSPWLLGGTHVGSRLRAFPGRGTFSAETGTVLANQGEWVASE